MARRENELFIGSEYLNIEGRTIKHPALIKRYATLNINKISKKPIKLIGLDIETDSNTAELKLFGVWTGTTYSYTTNNFLLHLYKWVKWACRRKTDIAYWNRLDPFVLYKTMLNLLHPNQVQDSLERFGKVGGEWDNKIGKWKVHPVCEVEVNGVKFGIRNVIRSSVQFFYYVEGSKTLNTVWAYDIAQLYDKGIEAEALYNIGTKENPMPRLSYYTKIDKSAHLVDWNRFETDEYYRNEIVLKSNELDARAVYDLGLLVSKDFKKAFNYYPVSLVSSGSLARAGIVASVFNHYKLDPDDKENPKRIEVADDISAMSFIHHYDRWLASHGADVVKQLYAIACESYSGGLIEAKTYGYLPNVSMADLTQAYPMWIQQLKDLRESTIETGIGEPPRIKNSYIMIRGTVNIPEDVSIHPLTVKHPLNKETNIRPVGIFRASYILEERDFLIEQGATFTDEEWYAVVTKGDESPLARVSKQFSSKRLELLSMNDSAEYRVKKSGNSVYGLTMEAVDTYEEQLKRFNEEVNLFNDIKNRTRPYLKKINLKSVKDELKYVFGHEYKRIYSRFNNPNGRELDDVINDIESSGIIEGNTNVDKFIYLMKIYDNKETATDIYERVVVSNLGYRAGEFFNPIYATFITAMTRIQLCRAALEIEKKGGKVALLMTDSIFWTGGKDLLPIDMYREKKTTGYFEKPKDYTDFLCLGSGRYEYRSSEGIIQAKTRGLNAVDFHDPNGVWLSKFSWLDAMKDDNTWVIDDESKEQRLKIKVRTLISVGMIVNSKEYRVSDLGRIIEVERTVDLIVGKSKRKPLNIPKDLKDLLHGTVETVPLYLDYGMFGKGDKVLDQTLPLLREKLMSMNALSKADKTRIKGKARSKKYRSKKGDDLKESYNSNYAMLKDLGYSRDEAKRMSNWSIERVRLQLTKDGRV